MKSCFLIILLIATSFSLCAQTPPINNQGCNFTDELHYKDGKAILSLKAKFDGYSKSGVNNNLQKLESEKKLRSRDYLYEISFYPENCRRRFGAAIKHNGALNLRKLRAGAKLYLTLVVYRIANSPRPYFVIDNLSVIK